MAPSSQNFAVKIHATDNSKAHFDATGEGDWNLEWEISFDLPFLSGWFDSGDMAYLYMSFTCSQQLFKSGKEPTYELDVSTLLENAAIQFADTVGAPGTVRQWTMLVWGYLKNTYHYDDVKLKFWVRSDINPAFAKKIIGKNAAYSAWVSVALTYPSVLMNWRAGTGLEVVPTDDESVETVTSTRSNSPDPDLGVEKRLSSQGSWSELAESSASPESLSTNPDQPAYAED